MRPGNAFRNAFPYAFRTRSGTPPGTRLRARVHHTTPHQPPKALVVAVSQDQSLRTARALIWTWDV